MVQLGCEALDDAIHVWRVTNDELDNVLQWVIALRLRVQAALAALLPLKDRDLKDHATAKLRGLELEAVEFANGAQYNPLKFQGFYRLAPKSPPIMKPRLLRVNRRLTDGRARRLPLRPPCRP